MEVSDKVKEDYHASSVKKFLEITIDGVSDVIENDRIYSESMELEESVIDGNSVEFVGCISSMFKIQIYGLTENIKGKSIKAIIYTENTKDEPITLFNGIVDSAVKQSNRRITEITAYDELYTSGNTDVADWYNALSFPVTIKELRDSLFEYIGMEQEEATLPSDDISILKEYSPATLQALSVIKSICQINGAWGIVNRSGKFEYRIPNDILYNAYPSSATWPGESMFPGIPQDGQGIKEELAELFTFYRNVSYEEYSVVPVQKVTIRQSDDETGYTYGGVLGDNKYIVQSNMFTYNLSESNIKSVAKGIYQNLVGFSFQPFTSSNNGLPYLECGLNGVEFYMIDYENSTSGNLVYETKIFYIMNRKLTGIQSLKDSYSAEGDEYQSEFITDLQTQIDGIKSSSSSSSGSGDSSINVVSIPNFSDMPDSPDTNTIYLIQGVVVVN
ncbi:MAG: hypothetical protein LUI12_01725 [Clostridiales bacterium]|nr:hypothetical protein [Clostridiales bacterium]